MTDPSSSSALVRVEGTGDATERERLYRKGIWTLEETMILLEAKKQDDERRMRGGDKDRGKTAELRWKWVENYCFKNGCIRSQNQCNDKWDNLLRDYKKVREHESRLGPGQPSYWQLEKHERKEKGLPSNLLSQVYEALHEVVDKRYGPRVTHVPSSADTPMLPLPSLHDHKQQQQHHQQHHASQSNSQQQQQAQQHQIPHQPGLLHPQQQQHPSQQQVPPPPYQTQQNPPASGSLDISEGSESEGSELPHSPAKRRRVWRSVNNLGPAMSKCTEDLTQTLMACEERKDKRHRDILNVEQRKLHLEETKTQISREGIAGLVEAVNNLAKAILTLASEKSAATD